jgi:hypothetical protein
MILPTGIIQQPNDGPSNTLNPRGETGTAATSEQSVGATNEQCSGALCELISTAGTLGETNDGSDQETETSGIALPSPDDTLQSLALN